tara:strand:+ start:1058 stop:1654 length:597 start_codon:yes stop_codon:yes gene_type:complete
MPRGKKVYHQQSKKERERIQNSQIEKIESLVREQTAKCMLEKEIVKNYEHTLPNKLQYAGVNITPKFTVNELGTAMQLSSFIDMSNDLNEDVDLNDMMERFGNNCDETTPSFRFYMRNANNFKRFAVLQSCIEKMYSIEPQADLQGWILNYGTMFVFGGVRFSIQESIERIHEAMRELCEQILAANDDLSHVSALTIE